MIFPEEAALAAAAAGCAANPRTTVYALEIDDRCDVIAASAAAAAFPGAMVPLATCLPRRCSPTARARLIAIFLLQSLYICFKCIYRIYIPF